MSAEHNNSVAVPASGSSASSVVQVAKSKLPSPISISNIFHVLLLPGGNLEKDSDASTDTANKNKNQPNVIIDINDYLYQRHVYRKQAAARRRGAGGAVKMTDETEAETETEAHDMSLNLNALASPLEIALVSCCVCVRPAATTNIIDNNLKLKRERSFDSADRTQRSRLHRPILPSNYFHLTGEDEIESDHLLTEHESASITVSNQPSSLLTMPSLSTDTPRVSTSIISMKNQNPNPVGTLRKGQEAHFLKLLQMYCPQCSRAVMYRSLVVEILQRTADWESGAAGGADMMSTDNNSNNNNSNASNGKNVGIGQVGYTFRKQFHSGWYIGRVTEIIPTNIRGGAASAAGTTTTTTVKDRRCVYNDGDEEDLSLEELKYLAELEELDRYHHGNYDDDDDDDDEQEIRTKGVVGGDGNNDDGNRMNMTINRLYSLLNSAYSFIEMYRLHTELAY